MLSPIRSRNSTRMATAGNGTSGSSEPAYAPGTIDDNGSKALAVYD
ncbi:hypothetical protein [Microseira wollei]|nr:hypothetical protein [Microseira wollei]